MRTLVAGDAASSLGTCSKLLSHGRVIYQIRIFDASEKIRKISNGEFAVLAGAKRPLSGIFAAMRQAPRRMGRH